MGKITASIFLILPLYCVLLSLPAVAEQPSANAPVKLSADELGYDRKRNMVIAVGNVEVIQGDTILLADNITYDQKRNVVHAAGNVSVLESSGNVFFAENVELKDDLKKGVIYNFRARLKDDSLFAAREARRVDENVTELEKAVYSPCKICEENAVGGSPLWQIKSGRVTYDEQEQKITYRNAWFEVYGVPVFYTPYLSHATPDADSKSGFLIPRYTQSSLLGTVVETPFYVSIAPNIDATITPIYTSNEGGVLVGEYRHLVRNGYFEFKGSITNPDKRDDTGRIVAGRNEIRGHMEASGHMALSEVWGLGLDVKRTTDDTYLQRYNFGNEDTLTSRAFIEGLSGRNYAVLEGLAFQGLRVNDDPDTTPLIMPMGQLHYESAPMWLGSRAIVDSNIMVLTREIGAKSRRLSLSGGWNLPYITTGGQVVEIVTSLRGDIYSVEDQTLINGNSFGGTVGRIIPQLEVLWRYPLIRRFDNGGSFIVEPTVGAAISPNGSNSDKIPNEDNQVLEFSDANLFSASPFPGLDRVETGPRVNYGVRGQLQLQEGRNMHFLFGQHFQTNEKSSFPYTNNPNEDLSDYVGRIGTSIDALDLDYRFRLDRENFDPKRNEINALVNWNPVQLAMDYIMLDDDPFLANREELFTATALRLSENWTFNAGARRDLSQGRMVHANGGLTFQNECLAVYTNLTREFTRDRDIEPSTSFSVRLSLKNID